MSWQEVYDKFLVLEDYRVAENMGEERFIELYGNRAWEIARMMALSASCDFEVPRVGFIPIEFSRKLNEGYDPLAERYRQDASTAYTDAHPLRLTEMQELIEPHVAVLTEFANRICPGRLIYRAGSGVEGFHRKLSFAGVAKSYIQKVDDKAITIGHALPYILSSTSSEWSQYYFSTHGVKNGYDVGINFMELVDHPFLHATAYVFPTEVRAKFFVTPEIGTQYSGGYDVVFPHGADVSEQLPEHIRHLAPVWESVLGSLRRFYNMHSTQPQPLDVELLVSGNAEKFQKYFVQDRLVSAVHVENYSNSSLMINFPTDEAYLGGVGKHHLYHSVLTRKKYSIIDFRRRYEYLAKQDAAMYVIDYEDGQGMFRFLTKLPTEMHNIGLIVVHPDGRIHDHQQYAVYEDPRITFVCHVNAKEIEGLEYGKTVIVRSNGNQIYFTEKAMSEFAITEVTSLAGYTQDNVSASFVFAIKDGKILATLNERGWDILGGFGETRDVDPVETAMREVFEEGGAEVTREHLIPFAYVKHGEYAKGMLFFLLTAINLES
ncbi:MAG: NUDIX domain-containing protein [Candidatus Peribacteria bacterium]|nr:MAG: NUDIX domain-containing protein [Candidatus Peribacteria bacterium]